jgi:hypothetical protein
MPLVRITKREAKKRFAQDLPVILCPCKLRAGPPWHPQCEVRGGEYLLRAESYRDHPDLWDGTLEETAWSLMYHNWKFHNTSCEMGYYAHYYVEI